MICLPRKATRSRGGACSLSPQRGEGGPIARLWKILKDQMIDLLLGAGLDGPNQPGPPVIVTGASTAASPFHERASPIRAAFPPPERWRG
jgi:hypothetical protein